MYLQLQKNWRFAVVLTAVCLLHFLMLLIPVVKQSSQKPYVAKTIQVELKQTPPPDEIFTTKPETPKPPPVVEQTPAIQPEPVKLAESPLPSTSMSTRPEPEPRTNSSLILSRQFDYEEPEQLFRTAKPKTGDEPDYHVRARAGLEDVLNEPSLQLPFRDTRIYLVNSYSPGIAGSVEKFWDDVTVPFGFTTKNNTRIQCAWVMIIAGCSWGHVSLFQQNAKRRKPDRPDS